MLAFQTAALGAVEIIESDVCVYGGTSGGVVAAVQATRMGKTAVVVEFGRHLGGLSSGGLGATDIGNKTAIGGISREFYRRLGKHYGKEEQWTFEPHVAENIFYQMVNEAGVPVYLEQRLASVKMDGLRITEIATRSGKVFRAKMFVDATYEGDLMAKAKVSYTVGREANSKSNETLNGVRAETPKHQFTVPVDPYVKPGEPSSGLLPFVQSGEGGRPGEGDRSVQAYNYRLCFTTNAAQRLPLPKPANYDPAIYELLGRYLEALLAAGQRPRLSQFWNPIWMPNGKTDINNNGGFSTDFIGMNHDYPEADYGTREKIVKAHEDYTRGFIHFLATDPRVSQEMREEMRRWGPVRDEFLDTGGWPHQLYVREARRMISDHVMTEHNCRGTLKAEDSVGLGAYNMDSHNCQRIVRNGRVLNEGDVQVAVKPYAISYRSIVPRQGECENLFVPVCLSATHIAYGSIRMEPVFMILGQSAATAACLAIDERIPVQKVNYRSLSVRLLADKQVLQWTAPK
ncbi:MAG: FAD-dependent oxidoreductase [Verrucomicrobia bacterium]|nr:FAD-dependent oxidoreductase [Verrucomicrobiota bacterium]